MKPAEFMKSLHDDALSAEQQWSLGDREGYVETWVRIGVRMQLSEQEARQQAEKFAEQNAFDDAFEEAAARGFVEQNGLS